MPNPSSATTSADQQITPAEATQMFLDQLKSTNPSSEVRAVIVELEKATKKRPLTMRGKHTRKVRHA